MWWPIIIRVARSMAQVKEVGEMIASFGREAMSNLTGKKEG